jgi:hypothetical protein
MAGAATMALLAAKGAQAAQPSDPVAGHGAIPAASPLVLAQNETAPSNAELEGRLKALEEEFRRAEMRRAAEATGPASTGWWDDTVISGRMYFDVSNIDHESNGTKTAAQSDNGTNFDVKRLYIGIDHTFNHVFSANVTTDFTYDGGVGASQLYLKRAYLQARIDPALIVRVGAAQLPWVPYVEGLYGYRYLEDTLTELPRFANSSDWGVHVLGSMLNGILSYDFAAVNGGGYKKAPTGGGTNRFRDLDVEGRISMVYDGFNLGIGGHSGKLGQPYGVRTYHTADRFDVVGAYVANGLRLGIEYFSADNWKTVTSLSSDHAHGWSAFGSYRWRPRWAVFGRFDETKPSTRLAPAMNDDYYNFGITWSPAKIVDLSLAYKHDGVSHGILATQNGAGGIGGSAAGSYDEVGIFGDFQF